MEEALKFNKSKSSTAVIQLLPPKWSWYPFPRQYLVSLLGSAGSPGCIHVYLLRVNMSFAIVAMTTNHSITDEFGNVTYVKCNTLSVFQTLNDFFNIL